MTSDLLLLCLDAAMALSATLLGLAALIRRPREVNAWLSAALCGAIVAHVLLGRQDYGPWIAAPFRISLGSAAPWLDLARNAAPGLFMLLAYRLFTDRGWPSAWMLALFALQMGLEGPLRLVGLERLTEFVPTALQLLFAAAAAWWTVADWRADLVDARRRARAVLLLILAISVVASSLLLRVVIPGDSPANYQAHVLLTVFNALLLAALLVRGGWSALQMPATARARPSAPAAPAAAAADEAALARLRLLLEQDRIYRDPDLDLTQLARRVGVAEYRLRRLIHERLGFRTFNAFLHAHRIAEVAAALQDPAERRTPILTLALDAGYRSVNTFNRGFRGVMGVTPSEFRQRIDTPPAASPKTA
jgi:AraC-like DNA-binding protein